MNLIQDAQAVFFDLFDTLIRIDRERLRGLRVEGRWIYSTVPTVHEDHLADREVPIESFLAALREAVREISALKRDNWIEVSAIERWRRVVTALDLESDPALAQTLTDAHARELANAAVPVEGAREVLERVRDRGLEVALISNFDHTPAAHWILEQTGLADLIEKRVVSEALGVRKPHERMFHEALEHFDVDPVRTVHVGDQAKADAWGAGRLGLRTVWINPAAEPYPEDDHPPTLTVERLADLAGHL